MPGSSPGMTEEDSDEEESETWEVRRLLPAVKIRTTEQE
jgi:hypothetical protein